MKSLMSSFFQYFKTKLSTKAEVNRQEVMFFENGRTFLSMRDFLLISPDKRHSIELTYAGEPPHGDSFYFLTIDGNDFPGWAWGCYFAISGDSQYLAFSWMEKRIERKTVVVDLQGQQYFVLPNYVYDLEVSWPEIVDIANGRKIAYRFSGAESWRSWDKS